ncbi:flippase [Bacteroidota bacterium]
MAKRRLFQDILGVFNSNIFSLFAGVLFSVLLTRMLGPEGFGIFTALIIIPTLIVSFTHLGIRGAAIYHVGKKTYDLNELISTIFVLLIFSSLLGMVLSAITYYFFFQDGFTLIMVVLAICVIPPRLAIVYFGGIYLGKDEVRKANQLNWLTNLINLILAAILVWWFDLGILGAVISLFLSSLVVSVNGIINLSKAYVIRLRINMSIIRNLFKLGILFALAFFVIQLNFRLDILLLEKLSTIEELGIYSLSAHIAEQIWQIPLAMGIIIFSRTSKSGGSRETTLITLKLLRISVLLSLLASITAFFLAPFLIPLVFGEEFTPSVLILQWLLPGIILMVIFRLISGQIAGMGKPQVTIYVFIPALIINILLNFLWIPEHGALGAAWATNVSYIFGSVIYLIAYARIAKVSFSEIIAYKKSDFSIVKELWQKFRKK